MRKYLGIALAGLAILSACATTPPSLIPEGYTGPVAHIADTVKVIDSASAEFYFVEKVNGVAIRQSFAATADATYGQGLRMTTVPIERDIPAEPSTLVIVGRNDYAAPIQALTNKIYRVKGEVTFTPASGGSYVVLGTLGPDYSAVWIEDRNTGQVVGSKVEVHGSAELGFFEK